MMKLARLKIAVLEGGPGAEREVSLRSGLNVAQWLREAGAAEVIEIDVRDENFVLPPDVNLVFNIIHGTFGEDGRLQSILEARGIPYTGEGVRGSELAFDKILTKRRFEERGVATPAYEVISKDQQPTFPVADGHQSSPTRVECRGASWCGKPPGFRLPSAMSRNTARKSSSRS